MHYLLFYEVAEDYIVRRAEFRSEHLEKAWKASEEGELVLAGALADPVDGAVLLFRGDSPEVAERFARADPYVIHGLVKHWRVREWSTVAGEGSATPIRPNPTVATNTTKLDVASSAAGDSFAADSEGKILRMWRAQAAAKQADQYAQYVTQKVFPALCAIVGYRGARLLRRPVDGTVELVVLTRWDSMDAVRKFAGPDAERAVVEPEARAILLSFDEFVRHFEIVCGTESAAASV